MNAVKLRFKADDLLFCCYGKFVNAATNVNLVYFDDQSSIKIKSVPIRFSLTCKAYSPTTITIFVVIFNRFLSFYPRALVFKRKLEHRPFIIFII